MRRTWALLGSSLVLSLVAGCSSDSGSSSHPGANAGGSSALGSGGSAANGNATGGTASGGTKSGGTGGSAGTTSGSSGGSSGSSGASGSAGSAGSAGTAGTASADCQTTALEPTPLRRLTRFEYANTVKDLLKVDPSPTSDMPADEVSDGYDNDAAVLTVSSLHAEKYVLVSETLAKSAVQNLSALTTCDTTAMGEDACALAFAKSFGRRAFRRPTTPNDEQALMAAYSAGKTGGSYTEGIEVMIREAL
jgi:hypothetical protein